MEDRLDRAEAGVSIALVGASSLLGREIKDRIADGPLAAAHLHLFETGAREGTLTDRGGEATVALQAEPGSFDAADIVVLACPSEDAERILGYPRKDGATVVDLSGAASTRGAPLIVMPAGIDALPSGGGIVRAPRSIPLFLGAVLGAAGASARLAASEAVVFEPASGLSREAMDELYQQAIHLLSFSDVPRDVYGRQMAFNLVPLTLAPGLGGAEREAALSREAAETVGWEPGRLSLKILVAAVFHTHAALVRLVGAPGSELRPDALREVFRKAGFSLEPGPGRGEDAEEAGRSTPVEWAGEERIRIGEVVADGTAAARIWALCDDLKAGAARNAAQLCEALVKGIAS